MSIDYANLKRIFLSIVYRIPTLISKEFPKKKQIKDNSIKN